MLVLVLLILCLSFIFKEKFVKWKGLVLQRMQKKKTIIKNNFNKGNSNFTQLQRRPCYAHFKSTVS